MFPSALRTVGENHWNIPTVGVHMVFLFALNCWIVPTIGTCMEDEDEDGVIINVLEPIKTEVLKIKHYNLSD